VQGTSVADALAPGVRTPQDQLLRLPLDERRVFSARFRWETRYVDERFSSCRWARLYLDLRTSRPEKGALVNFRRIILTALVGAFFVVPSGAFAQSTDPLVQVYSSEGPKTENQITPPQERVQNQVSPPGEVEAQVVSETTPEAPTAAAQPQESSGELPFTGLDARLLLLAGIALFGIGFATRRLAARVD
jgi:hypothetical protein